MSRIDLHVHSTASDGEFSPDEVVRRAAVVGVATIGLTDHDTIAGVATARETGVEYDVRVIAGCEFSVRAAWGEMHVLGYFLPPDDPELEAFLQTQRTCRVDRMAEITRRLTAAGVPLELDDVERLADGGALGRPHAARALVRAGAATDVQDAFDRYLGRGRPAFVGKQLPSVEEVTGLVSRGGGVTVAAHLRDRGTRSVLRRLRDQGLDGVEVGHPSHDDATRARLQRLAGELDLLPSGGSDWHGDPANGSGRPGLGEIPFPPQWLDDIERRHESRRAQEVPNER